VCGIDPDLAGYSVVGGNGERRGFLVDQCNAVAAAVLGEVRVEYVTVAPSGDPALLRSRRIDLLATATPWSFQRDVDLGLEFGGISLYREVNGALRSVGAQVREGDDRWLDVVRWSLNVMIAAEELGVSRDNVEALRTGTRDARVRRLFGRDGGLGGTLGLSPNWAYDVVRLVGNHGDVWQRNLAPLGEARGVNALWLDGGALYALPFK
jgi:hypothetical protein